MEYEINEFDPQKATDEFWEIYFEFTETNFRYHNPDDPLPNREGIIQRQKTEIPYYHVKRWLAITPENKVIAWAGFGAGVEGSSDYEENKHLCNMNIAVLADYVRKGIGTDLLKRVVQEAQILGKTTMEVSTDTDPGRAFLEHFGAQLAIEAAENRLDLEDIDWDLMQSWVDESSKRAEEVTIESFYECPEEILEEYSELYTEALNMQPLGDTEHRANIDGKLRRELEQVLKDRGFTNYTLISREKDGKISGLTEILYDSRESYKILQELTGVRPEFRGRGLGKWLKGKMILHIRDNYPDVEVIIAGNAEANAPMNSINERMGFKKHKAAGSYKVLTEDIAKRLEI